MRNLIVLFVLISFLFGANMARADRQPEEVFKGRVLVSEKRFPMTARSSSAYIDQLNKNSTDRIETDKNTGDCNFYFIAFFLQPAKQIQVNLILT